MSTTTRPPDQTQTQSISYPSNLSSQLFPNLETLQKQLDATTSLLTSAQTELEHLLSDVSGAVNELEAKGEHGNFITRVIHFWFGEFVTAQGLPVGALGDGRALLAAMGALGQTFQAVSQLLSTHGPAISAGMGAIALIQRNSTVLKDQQQFQDATAKINKMESALVALGGGLVTEADTLTGNVTQAAPSSMSGCLSGVDPEDSNTVPADLQPNSTWPGSNTNSSSNDLGSNGLNDSGWKGIPPFGLNGPSSSSPTASPSSSPFTNLQPTSLPSTPTPLLFTSPPFPSTPGPTPPPGPNAQLPPGQGPLNFPAHLNPTPSSTPGPTPGQISLLTGSGIAASTFAVPGLTFKPGNNPNLNPGTGPNFNPRAASEFITTTVPGTGTSIETSPDTSPTLPQDCPLDPLTPGAVPALFPLPPSSEPSGSDSNPASSPFPAISLGIPNTPTSPQNVPTAPAYVPGSVIGDFPPPEPSESRDPVFPPISVPAPPGAEPVVTVLPEREFDPFTFTIQIAVPAASSSSSERFIVIEPPTSLTPEPGPGPSQPGRDPVITAQSRPEQPEPNQINDPSPSKQSEDASPQPNQENATPAEPGPESTTPAEPISLLYPNHAVQIEALLQQSLKDPTIRYRSISRFYIDGGQIDPQSGLPFFPNSLVPSHAYNVGGWERVREVMSQANTMTDLLDGLKMQFQNVPPLPLIWATTDLSLPAQLGAKGTSGQILAVIKPDPQRILFQVTPDAERWNPTAIYSEWPGVGTAEYNAWLNARGAAYMQWLNARRAAYKEFREEVAKEFPFLILRHLDGIDESVLGPYIRKDEIIALIRILDSATSAFSLMISKIIRASRS